MRKKTSVQEQFDQAAAETRQRIRTDVKKTPQRISMLLVQIEESLYDPNLDYQQVRRVCNVRDNNTATLFHKTVGLPPAAYIRECRMQTAARLIAETQIQIWQIAEMVGYTTIQVFGRAFKRWSGRSPRLYRNQSQGSAESRRAAANAGKSRTKGPSEAVLRQALTGGLESKQVGALVQQLTELYPDVDPKQLR